MKLQDKLVWSEGMFLKPQHFQQQDRYHENLNYNAMKLNRYYCWGISELKLDQQMLSLGNISILRCTGVMPDGTFFSIPDRDAAPEPLAILPETTNCKIYLSLPLSIAGRSEVGKDLAEHCRYYLQNNEIDNVNAGQSELTTVQVAKLSLHLIPENKQLNAVNCLPIAMVAEIQSQQIILTDSFLPSCLDLRAIPQFFGLLREILGLLQYRGDMLAKHFTVPGLDGITEFADLILLQMINRYEAIIKSFLDQPGIHPQLLYQALISLAAELATFSQESRRVSEFTAYQHHDLSATFLPLLSDIRRALSVVLEESAVKLPLIQQSSTLWSATLADKVLLADCMIIVAVHASMQQDQIKQQFPAQTKIAPIEEIRQLVHRALPGLELQPLSVVPRKIPYHVNFVYFSINREHEFWQKLINSVSIAFHIGGEFPELRLEVWMLKL